MKVQLKDGSVLTASAEYTRGDPKNPRSESELTEKFNDVSKRVWSEKQAEAVFEDVMSFEKIEDVHAFFTRHAI